MSRNILAVTLSDVTDTRRPAFTFLVREMDTVSTAGFERIVLGFDADDTATVYASIGQWSLAGKDLADCQEDSHRAVLHSNALDCDERGHAVLAFTADDWRVDSVRILNIHA